MKITYADPPYIGLAGYYPEKEEVDHKQLILDLDAKNDGWALSCSTPSLPEILSYCPEGIRVGAWVKPFCSFKPGVNPAYAWEPVVFKGGRQPRSLSENTVRDWVSCNITLKKGLTGAKPEGFSFWLFELMGMQPDDEFVDLFPGTGGVTDAWNKYRGRLL